MNLKQFIQHSLDEDTGTGDHTSLSCIPKEAVGTATLLAKDNGIIAGVKLAEEMFHLIDADLKIEHILKDAAPVKPIVEVMKVHGSVHSILKAERIVLNTMQRMSGIATYTRSIMDIISHTKAKVLDTRKTTPNFRYFEKLAVRIGGGENHRMGLYDVIMIKDNHIDFAGGISNAIESCHKYLKENNLDLKIIVESRNFEEVKMILNIGGINRILLDNFTPEETKEAVKFIGDKVDTESSGGINETNIIGYAEAGVDYISLGALTHQYRSMDLSLKASF
ncbi:MAG: nicotinate-nucleotide pyrophosphorylase (carboxylating) [Patiriisocius sp.]|jgi:nicotinate-nucleotide pyrophosphorylase (carboxylating)